MMTNVVQQFLNRAGNIKRFQLLREGEVVGEGCQYGTKAVAIKWATPKITGHYGTSDSWKTLNACLKYNTDLEVQWADEQPQPDEATEPASLEKLRAALQANTPQGS